LYAQSTPNHSADVTGQCPLLDCHIGYKYAMMNHR